MVDIGHALACIVTPYEFDGTPEPNLALRSDTIIPEGGGTPILPAFLKAAFDGFDVAHLVTSDEPGLVCGLAVVQPELFGVICLHSLLDEAAITVFGEALKEAVDPPDSRYTEIALPDQAVGSLPRPCPRRVTGRSCRMLTRRANAYGIAESRVGGLVEALAVSRNRTLIARKKGDSPADMTQSAARKVYAGQLADAIPQQHAASLAYANVLARLHLNVRIPAKTLKRVGRQSVTRIYGRALIAKLRSDGFTHTEIVHALRQGRTRITSFNLLRYLKRPPLRLPFARYYKTIDLTDLNALIAGLTHQHALPASSTPTLYADLDQARAACSPTLRATAIQQFLKDAKPNLSAAYRSFLTTAAQPLANKVSRIDPYPNCLK
jgi:hypothetical protein